MELESGFLCNFPNTLVDQRIVAPVKHESVDTLLPEIREFIQQLLVGHFAWPACPGIHFDLFRLG